MLKKTQGNMAWLFTGAVFLLILNLFLLIPLLTQTYGIQVANNLYMGFRLIVVIAFSFLAVPILNKKHLSIIRFSSLLVFFDQVLLKAVYLKLGFENDPKSWEGIDAAGIYFSLFMSYIASVPFVILISFLGAELGILFESKKTHLKANKVT